MTGSPMRVSPWNVAVGAWLGAVRRRRKLSSEQMAASFGEAIRPAYLRTLEAGQNSLPATAVRGLVDGYGLSFASAAMLVAAVRMLDIRQAESRAFDLERLAKAASEMGSVWPASGPLMEWLQGQIDLVGNGDPEALKSLRLNARTVTDAFDAMLSDPTPTPRAGEDADEQRGPDVNPFFAETLDALVRRLALMPPELTQDQVKQWEQETAERWTGVWGVVSDATAVLRVFSDYDWSFLLNPSRPPLRIFVPIDRRNAANLQKAFVAKAAKRLLRAGTGPEALNVQFFPWGEQTPRIRDLLHFDHTTRRVAPAIPYGRGENLPDSVTRFWNAWLYEVGSPVVPGMPLEKRRVGFLDSYTLKEPRYYCATLGGGDLRLWFKTLGAIYA